jgi:hypothetical protein
MVESFRGMDDAGEHSYSDINGEHVARNAHGVRRLGYCGTTSHGSDTNQASFLWSDLPHLYPLRFSLSIILNKRVQYAMPARGTRSLLFLS